MSDETVEQRLGWVRQGTELFMEALESVTKGRGLGSPTQLPGWTGGHVAAHVAANASALSNLARWARTTIETPMYASSEARTRDIEDGAKLDSNRLGDWLVATAAELDEELASLEPDMWMNTVRTAQGREVPATEIPWLRAREVFIHAIDLEPSMSFAVLPEDFLVELREEIAAKRQLDVSDVRADLPDLVAWLAGRPYGLVQDAQRQSLAPLSPWL